MAKQKQWMGAWSLMGRREWTLSGGMYTRSPWLNIAVLTVDGHDALAVHDVIELVGGVGVRIHQAASRHLEFVDQLEEAAVGDVLELAGLDHPPHRNGPVVLDDGCLGLNAAHVHVGDLFPYLD